MKKKEIADQLSQSEMQYEFLKDHFSHLEKTFIKEYCKLNERYAEAAKKLNALEEKFLLKNEVLTNEIRDLLATYNKRMHDFAQVTATAEQTMVNVLAAIRQNEYLQAYYPAQGGIPEMKVSGKHPLQEKRVV